jgi:glycosyltransferase 2 family protein
VKWLSRLGGAVLGLAATVYFLKFVHTTVTRYEVQPLLSAPMAVATGMAALAYASIVPVTSWAWGRLLRDIGVRLAPLQLNMIIGLTQIAKYMPGGIGQHLGRSALSIQQGMPPGPLFATLAVELVLAIEAAISVGVVALVVALDRPLRLPLGDRPLLSLATLGLGTTLAGLFALKNLPSLTRRIAPFLAPDAAIQLPGGSALGAAFSAYVLNYVLIGSGLYAIADVAGGVQLSTLPLCVGTFALSWVAGFVVPFAPAGLGVREGVMIALLSPTLDAATALKVVVAFRISTTTGDLLGLMWGGAICLARSRNDPPTPAHLSAPMDSQHDT